MRRWMFASVPLALVVSSGCSLALDFSGFQEPHDSAISGDLDAAAPDAPGLDAAGPDAPGLDAAGPDAAVVDAAVLDAPGLDAPGLDAHSPDAASSTDMADAFMVRGPDAGGAVGCSGLMAGSITELGPITGLRAVIRNTRFVVSGVGNELAIAWEDGSQQVHLRTWRLSGDTLTPVTSTLVGTLAVSNAELALGRSGSAWTVWMYPRTVTTLRVCADGASACTDLTPPTGAVSPYAMAQGPSTFAYVSSNSTATAWRAVGTGTSNTPFNLTTFPARYSTPQAVATTGDSYVAFLDDESSGTSRATFAWFDVADRTVMLSRHSITMRVERLYLAYDAHTETAVGLVADLTGVPPAQTYVIAAQRGAPPTMRAMWNDSSPLPLVSRGDGTVLVDDGTGYGLRRVLDLGTEVSPITVPGTIGAPVVLGGRYGYLAIFDEEPDVLGFQFFDCR